MEEYSSVSLTDFASHLAYKIFVITFEILTMLQ